MKELISICGQYQRLIVHRWDTAWSNLEHLIHKQALVPIYKLCFKITDEEDAIYLYVASEYWVKKSQVSPMKIPSI